jgi:hypothetical protein
MESNVFFLGACWSQKVLFLLGEQTLCGVGLFLRFGVPKQMVFDEKQAFYF